MFSEKSAMTPSLYAEFQKYMGEQQYLKEQEAAEKKARRTEINRKFAEDKKKKKTSRTSN